MTFIDYMRQLNNRKRSLRLSKQRLGRAKRRYESMRYPTDSSGDRDTAFAEMQSLERDVEVNAWYLEQAKGSKWDASASV